MNIVAAVKLVASAIILIALYAGYKFVSDDLEIRDEHKSFKREAIARDIYHKEESASLKRAEDLLNKRMGLDKTITEELVQNDKDDYTTILATDVNVSRVQSEGEGGSKTTKVWGLPPQDNATKGTSEDIQELPDELTRQGWQLYR